MMLRGGIWVRSSRMGQGPESFLGLPVYPQLVSDPWNSQFRYPYLLIVTKSVPLCSRLQYYAESLGIQEATWFSQTRKILNGKGEMKKVFCWNCIILWALHEYNFQLSRFHSKPDSINKFFHGDVPFFSFLMYFLSHGQAITKELLELFTNWNLLRYTNE